MATTRHIEWVDLYNNGVLKEVAVMRRDDNGDLYYILVDSLDQIDRRRMGRILQRRDANNYALWDLMSQVTLGNGVNALEYFHQLVRVRSLSGQHFAPGKAYGAGSFTPVPAAVQAQRQVTENAHLNPQAAVTESVESTQSAPAPRKGPGRPPKNPQG